MQKMFTKITEMVEDPQSLVLVLIDEVESLTCSRASCSNGTEPSDAVRVVNAVLTQLDQLKKYVYSQECNVVWLALSHNGMNSTLHNYWT